MRFLNSANFKIALHIFFNIIFIILTVKNLLKFKTISKGFPKDASIWLFVFTMIFYAFYIIFIIFFKSLDMWYTLIPCILLFSRLSDYMDKHKINNL